MFFVVVSSEHARLSPNTELIVAPKEREKHANDALDVFFQASPPCRVQVPANCFSLLLLPDRLQI